MKIFKRIMQELFIGLLYVGLSIFVVVGIQGVFGTVFEWYILLLLHISVFATIDFIGYLNKKWKV